MNTVTYRQILDQADDFMKNSNMTLETAKRYRDECIESIYYEKANNTYKRDSSWCVKVWDVCIALLNDNPI